MVASLEAMEMRFLIQSGCECKELSIKNIHIASFVSQTLCPDNIFSYPYGHILKFLDQSRYFLFQAAPQLYSWGWADLVPDPLLRESNLDLRICSQELWPLDHRDCPIVGISLQNITLFTAPQISHIKNIQSDYHLYGNYGEEGVEIKTITNTQ
jgi:hypothetical protein